MTSGMRRCLAEGKLAAAWLALASDATPASQGPGAGVGTAGHFTQLAMAVVVYGTAALVIGVGLVGMLRK